MSPLLLAAILSCATIASRLGSAIGADRSANLWKDYYEIVFGYDASESSHRSSDTLDLWVVYMHQHLADVHYDRSVTNEMRSTVERWFEFLRPTDVKGLTVRYLQDQHRQLVEARPQSTRLPGLFKLGQLNVFEACRKEVGNVNARFKSRLNTMDRSNLNAMHRVYRQWRSGEATEEQLANAVMKGIGSELAVKRSEILRYWSNSSCKKVEAVAGEFNQRKFRNLVELGEYNGLVQTSSASWDQFAVPGLETETPAEICDWARKVEMCKRLDEMISTLAKYNTAKKVAGRKMKDFINSTGTSG